MSDARDPTDLLTLRCLTDRASLSSSAPGPTSLHAILEVRPGTRGVDVQRPPLTVVFCIDVSGSMHGEPLQQVATSLGSLVDLLDDTDRIGLVAFSNRASVVLTPELLDAGHRSAAKRRARGLGSGGGTNIEAGLHAAALALGQRREHERQLIVLLSDGNPNDGASSPGALAAEVAKLRSAGVALTTLGYGQHHNEDILKAMADAGAGDYFYVSDPQQAQMEFARALGAQGDTVAEAVKLSLAPAEGVEVLDILGAPKPRFGPRGLTLPLPDLIEGVPRFFVVELSADVPSEGMELALLDVVVEARAAGGGEVCERQVRLSIPVRPQAGGIVAEGAMRVLLARAEIARQEARRLADQGQFDGAAACLRQILATIEGHEAYTPQDGSDLSDAVEQLIDEAVAYETKPSMEDYRHFRKATLGMDLQLGARQASDYASGSSIVYMDAVAGKLPPAWLEVVDGDRASAVGQRFALGTSSTIGRVPSAEVCIQSSSISRRHTRIVGQEGKFVVVDLGSTNGTVVNGEQLRTPRVLKDGDEVSVGSVRFRFRTEGEASS